MQFEGRRRSGQIPNLTPLIDVVFLLLVFFMLTSHFVSEQALDVDLPVAESGQTVKDDSQLEVVLDANGRFSVDAHIVDPPALEATLRKKLATRTNKVVRIRGDRQADLGNAVELLDTARKAGARSVEIVTEPR